MSHEWRRPDATWQGPDERRGNNAPQEEAPPQLNQQDDVAAIYAPTMFSNDEFEEEEIPPSNGFKTVRREIRRFSPILVPLLFAGLTFLFTVPLLLTNNMYLHLEQLWPFTFVLLAVASLQCKILYYAGSNHGLWWLGSAGGFLLFLLVACFTVFGPIPAGIFMLVVFIACLIGARLYVRPVPEGTVDIVYAFGTYSRTLYPGFNFLLPWEVVDSHLQTREKQWTSPEQIVQVSRDDDIHLKAVISYQLMPEDAYLAAARVENWEESLHQLFETFLQQSSNDLKPADFMAWPRRLRQGVSLGLNEAGDDESAHWTRVNNLLFQRMRDRVAHWGVLINWVYIRDITLTPHSSPTYATDPMTTFRADNSRIVPASAAPSQTQESARKAGPTGASRVEAPAAASASSVSTKIVKEDVLIKAYKQIQSEKIKSPATIREIAGSFLAIANDPEASKNASFDASRAAQALYDRANLYEKQASMSAVYEDDDSSTQVDWRYSNHSDEDTYLHGG